MTRDDSTELKLIPAPAARMYSLLSPCHSCSTLPIIRQSSRQAEFVFRLADNFFGPLPNALLDKNLTHVQKHAISTFMKTTFLLKWHGAQETSFMIILMLPFISQIDYFASKLVITKLLSTLTMPNFIKQREWLSSISEPKIPPYVFPVLLCSLPADRLSTIEASFLANLSNLPKGFFQDFVKSFVYLYPQNLLDMFKSMVSGNAELFFAHLKLLPFNSLTPSFAKLLKQAANKPFLDLLELLYNKP
jgi:hypothetical protein